MRPTTVSYQLTTKPCAYKHSFIDATIARQPHCGSPAARDVYGCHVAAPWWPSPSVVLPCTYSVWCVQSYQHQHPGANRCGQRLAIQQAMHANNQSRTCSFLQVLRRRQTKLRLPRWWCGIWSDLLAKTQRSKVLSPQRNCNSGQRRGSSHRPTVCWYGKWVNLRDSFTIFIVSTLICTIDLRRFHLYMMGVNIYVCFCLQKFFSVLIDFVLLELVRREGLW